MSIEISFLLEMEFDVEGLISLSHLLAVSYLKSKYHFSSLHTVYLCQTHFFNVITFFMV